MTILPRYVFREFMVPFTYCLLGFVAVYMLIDTVEAVGDIIKAKPSAWLVLRYMIGRIAICLEWLLPACLLLASLYTMWQFCRNSEVVAMRANGVSFLAITWPMLAVASLIALLCFANGEYFAPHAGEFAEQIRDSKFVPQDFGVREKVPFNNPLKHRLWQVARIDAKKPHILEGVKISVSRPDGTKWYDIEASEACYMDGAWWLMKPRWQYYDEFNSPAKSPHPEAEQRSLISMPDFDEVPQDFVLQNKAREFYSVQDRLRYLQTHPKLKSGEVAALWYDIYSRFAAPLACVVITLFAIPAGVATGRQSVFKGVLVAIAMFFGFYVAVTVCMVLAHREVLPPLLAAWIPNLGFLIAGSVLYYQQR